MKKNSKRVLSVCLVLLMVLMSAPLGGFVGIELPGLGDVFSTKAEAAGNSNYYTSGFCGEVTDTNDGTNLSWEITEDGTLTVTGTGRMAPEAFNYDLRIKKVIIGEGVENIADYAFHQCTNLVYIDIAESVTEIDSYAFYNCDSIQTINTSNVAAIKDGAFVSCNSLQTVEMPNVTTIGSYSFNFCTRIQTVDMPNVTTLGEYAFGYCSGIQTIEIPDVTTIGKNAFSCCSDLKTVSMPKVEKIGNEAFYECGLIDLELQNVKEISDHAFSNNSKLEIVSIGLALNKLNSTAFSGCSSLSRVDISEENMSYSSRDGIVYDKAEIQLVLVPSAIEGEITLPATVEEFSYQSVSSCKKLTAINVEEGNNNYTSVDGIVYSADKSKLLCCPRGKQDNVTVDSETTVIGSSAFYNCDSIQTINTSNVATIKDGAFESCNSLKTVEMPNVTTIGSYSFNFCTRIQTVDMPNATTLGEYAFGYCSGIQIIEIPNVTTIGKNAFSCCSDLKTVSMPKVEKIGALAFYQCGIVDLTLPKSLKTMDNIYLPNLKTLTIENPYFKLTSTSAPVTAKDCTVRAKCGTFGHTMATKMMLNFESLEHTFLDWYVITPATFEADGLEGRDCAYCSYTETRVLPKLQRESYTATFVADGKVVSKVEFPKDATSIEEPEVPAKNRHTGEWEDYTLANADITINAKYTVIKSNDASEIETDSKVVYYDETDDALFTLTATADSQVVKSTVSKSVPLDIVLVVDQSGSMDETLGGNVKKVDALKETANEFISTVFENAKLTGADHRISIAGFGISGNYRGFKKNENSELLTSGRGAVSFESIKPADYSSSLLNVNVSGAVNTLLTDAVYNIEARGATAADLGLEMAKGVFANTDSVGRERVVVFMTDGEPTYSNGFQTEVANSAIANAQVLKNAYKATVFSIGVFSSSQSSNRNINTFMNAVSSNYPNARSMRSLGITEGGDFFTTVNHTDNLASVFKTISTEALSHTAPFDDLTIIKTLSKYVTLTSQQEQTLRVDLIRKYGITNDDIIITRNDDGTTTIQIDKLKPQQITDENGNIKYQVSIEFFASLNENASQKDKYIVDTEDSGVLLSDASIYEVTFDTSEIETAATKSRVIFTINGEVYEILEGTSGSLVTAPEITISSDWNFSGWTTSGVKVQNGLVLDAAFEKAPRTITWHTANGDITQTYVEGDFIVPPAVDYNEYGDTFLSWNVSIPTAMPDENLEFTAVYGEHVHNFTSKITREVTCETNGTITYTCVCGKTYDETIDAIGHNYEAITPSIDKKDSKCTFVCQNCGNRYDYALDYQVVSTSGRNKKVNYEFQLTDDNLDVGFEPDGEIVIRIPLSDFHSTARSAKVTRTNEDGSKTVVPSRIEDGFLVITTDHFSPYEVDFDIECEEHTESDWIIETEATCKQVGSKHKECVDCCKVLETEEIAKLDHDYKETVVDPTCTTDGYTTHTCSVCGDSYVDSRTDATGHIDSDNDGKCNICGADLGTSNHADNCDHLCHKGGFVGFIYKIVRLFWKLFKINQYCKCGVAHY